MKGKVIITISRQYGSGGRLVGEKLAKALDIPFYDKELISMAAKESGIEERIFENADKQAVNSLLYSLSVGMYNAAGHIGGRFDGGVNGLPLNDRVFLAQYNVIREIAQKGSCVIVGRCADYVLKDIPGVMNVFIHSELSQRVKRATEEYNLMPEKAESTVIKMDKRRAAYYEYYTSNKWGKIENYDLTLNSGRIGLENTVELIRSYALVLAGE